MMTVVLIILPTVLFIVLLLIVDSWQRMINQSITNQSIPNQSIPNQSITNQSITNQSIPNQSIPNQSIPNQSITNQSIPTQVSPTLAHAFSVPPTIIENQSLILDATAHSKDNLLEGQTDPTDLAGNINIDYENNNQHTNNNNNNNTTTSEVSTMNDNHNLYKSSALRKQLGAATSQIQAADNLLLSEGQTAPNRNTVVDRAQYRPVRYGRCLQNIDHLPDANQTQNVREFDELSRALDESGHNRFVPKSNSINRLPEESRRVPISPYRSQPNPRMNDLTNKEKGLLSEIEDLAESMMTDLNRKGDQLNLTKQDNQQRQKRVARKVQVTTSAGAGPGVESDMDSDYYMRAPATRNIQSAQAQHDNRTRPFSPLESSIFSDSLENIMSDFDDAMSAGPGGRSRSNAAWLQRTSTRSDLKPTHRNGGYVTSDVESTTSTTHQPYKRDSRSLLASNTAHNQNGYHHVNMTKSPVRAPIDGYQSDVSGYAVPRLRPTHLAYEPNPAQTSHGLSEPRRPSTLGRSDRAPNTQLSASTLGRSDRAPNTQLSASTLGRSDRAPNTQLSASTLGRSDRAPNTQLSASTQMLYQTQNTSLTQSPFKTSNRSLINNQIDPNVRHNYRGPPGRMLMTASTSGALPQPSNGQDQPHQYSSSTNIRSSSQPREQHLGSTSFQLPVSDRAASMTHVDQQSKQIEALQKEKYKLSQELKMATDQIRNREEMEKRLKEELRSSAFQSSDCESLSSYQSSSLRRGAPTISAPNTPSSPRKAPMLMPEKSAQLLSSMNMLYSSSTKVEHKDNQININNNNHAKPPHNQSRSNQVQGNLARSTSCDPVNQELTQKRRPPAVPPKPATGAALIRTPSGTMINTSGFHSMRRSTQNLAHDDTMSDSEVAMSRSDQRYASLRRSRNMLEQAGRRSVAGTGPPPSHSAYTRRQTNDGTVSDAEEYTTPAPRYTRTQSSVSGYRAGAGSDTEDYATDGYSISGSASLRPPVLLTGGVRGSSTSMASSNFVGSTEFFKDQVSQWREEFTRQTGRVSTGDLSELSHLIVPVPTAQKRDNFTMTAPPERTSVGITANIDPPKVQSSATVQVKAACLHCDDRRLGRNRSTTGSQTPPAPLPKSPSKNAYCTECDFNKEKLKLAEEQGRIKIKLDRQTATEGSEEINRSTIGTNTARVEMCSIESTACISEPKVATSSVGTTVKPQTLEIGMKTDSAITSDGSTNTDQAQTMDRATALPDTLHFMDNGTLVNTGTGTEHNGQSIAIGTDPDLTGYKQPVPSQDMSVETELDMAALESLQSKKDVIVNSVAVNTDRPNLPREKCVGTEKLVQRHQQIGTDAVQAIEILVQTEEVEVRSPVNRRGIAMQTDKSASRTVFVNTEAAAPTIHRATETAIKMYERGTQPDTTMKNWSKPVPPPPGTPTPNEPKSNDSLQSVSPISRPESSETSECAVQTDSTVPEEPTPRTLDDDELWLMPAEAEKPETTSVGCGEGTIHGQECDHCARLQYSYTRHVGVGVCAVTDKVCHNCDKTDQLQSENDAPGFSQQCEKRTTISTSSSVLDTQNKTDRDLVLSSPVNEPTKHQRPSTLSPDSGLPEQSQNANEDEAEESPTSDSIVHLPNDDDDGGGGEEAEDDVDYDYQPAEPKKVDFAKPRGTRAFELSKAAALQKLLTAEEQKNKLNSPPSSRRFVRNTAQSKSLRVATKKGDSLTYITDKKKTGKTGDQTKPTNNGQGATVVKPVTKKGIGLSKKVEIKKDTQPDTEDKEVLSPTKAASALAIPAKIPRPKFAKYAPPPPSSTSPEEEEEVHDRLTPLRSEMVMVRSWSAGAKPTTPNQPAGYDNPTLDIKQDKNTKPAKGALVGTVQPLEGSVTSADYSSDSSESLEEGTYDAGTQSINTKCDPSLDGAAMDDSVTTESAKSFELTAPIKEACELLNKSLTNQQHDCSADKLLWANQYLQHEWLKAAARRSSNDHYVEAFLDTLEAYSPALIKKVVNMCDQNGNSSLHYAVSHGNFDIVSLLLDSKVCDLSSPNKAGYTPVMLAALCPVENDTQRMVVERLFHMGDVNIKAIQHGQTALMLSVSHGKFETAQLLVAAGAGLNVQDEDGSTALMCAAEHGHVDIVRWLLTLHDIDAHTADFDGSTALSIAVENGHRDIGVLIYAHLNYGKNTSSTSTTPTTNTNKLVMSTSSENTDTKS